jgi:hypothetical protein
MRRMGSVHPERVKVADWGAYARGRGGWFGSDGLHLTLPGADAFTAFVRDELLRYAPPPGRRLTASAS